MSMEKTEEQDHVDRWLESAWLEEIPNLDFEVEGIIDRMNGLSRRFKRTVAFWWSSQRPARKPGWIRPGPKPHARP